MAEDLQKSLRQMPGMVRWFSPGLLVWTAFREGVSRLFGQYADQRVIQHLSDPIPETPAERVAFVNRYDYSHEVGEKDSFWVDYAADVGDGFDPTYAIARLLAADRLEGGIGTSDNDIKKIPDLAASVSLEHGRLLLLGGDAIYPSPSREEYEQHLLKPYAWALPQRPGETARTDVFATPGNHDWYDGLAAFDNLFCRARNAQEHRPSHRFGDWQTRQHRSYFAIKLPNNWWIWGADIQLNLQIDSGQREYFQAIAEQMQPGDNFILCTAQPSWYYLDRPEERYERENLRTLIDAPIRRGAKLCAILAGDWHHYCRYHEAEQLNMNLITAGGGGAYLAGTHQLEPEVKFEWLGRNLAFRMDRRLRPNPTTGDQGPTPPTETNEETCYPSRKDSCRLARGNWRFPRRNWSFALAIGVIYWLLTWTFSGLKVGFWVDVPPSVTFAELARKIENPDVGYGAKRLKFDIPVPAVSPAATRSAPPPGAHWLLKEGDLDCQPLQDAAESAAPKARGQQATRAPQPAPPPTPQRGIRCTGSLPIANWTLFVIDVAMLARDAAPGSGGPARWWSFATLSGYGTAAALLFANSVQLLLLGIISSPLALAFLVGVWFMLYQLAEWNKPGVSARLMRILGGSWHFAAHLVAMWAIYCVLWGFNKNVFEDWFTQKVEGFGRADTFAWIPIEVWVNFIYALEMLLVSHLVGGLIFGFYLYISYRLFKIHADWTFSAMQITGYKCFLRMRFEKGRLTIYPIRLKHVPVRNRPNIPNVTSVWRPAKNPSPSLIEASKPMEPRLIEGPIVIEADKVRNIPRPPPHPGSA